MNLSEALKVLSEGKKLTRKHWISGSYLYVEDGKLTCFTMRSKKQDITTIGNCFANSKEDWEIWKDPNETTYDKLELGKRFKFDVSDSIYKKVRVSTTNGYVDGCMEDSTNLCFPFSGVNVKITKVS